MEQGRTVVGEKELGLAKEVEEGINLTRMPVDDIVEWVLETLTMENRMTMET